MFISMAHEGGLQLMVEPLDHSIGGGMPCSSLGERGTGDGSQSLEKAGLELLALVGCNLQGAAETSNPDRDEGLSDRFGCDGRKRECLRPTYVSVDGGETVPEAGRDRQWPDQVDMHMRKTGRREVETPERGLHMPRYLGPLAGCTCACPSAAVFTHSRPHKPLRHQLDGGVGLGVAKTMEGVKDLYVLTTLISRVTILVCTGRLLAAAFNTRHTLTHTDPLFQLPLLSQLCLCLLKPQCTDDKLSQPRGCGLARSVHHTLILYNNYCKNKNTMYLAC